MRTVLDMIHIFVWFERYVRFLTTRVVKHNYKSVSSPRIIAINREPFEEQDFVIRRAYLRKLENVPTSF